MTRQELDTLYTECLQRTRPAGKQHPQIQRVLGVQQNTKPNPQKLCVVEGIWAHEKALAAAAPFESFVCCPDLIHSQQAKELTVACAKRAKLVYQVSAKVFRRIAERGNPDGLLSLVELHSITLEQISLKAQNLVMIADGVEIPGNIGTIVRTLEGIGADALILCNRRARITHPKVLKASQGACFFVPIVELDEGVATVTEWLQEHHFKVYLADSRAERAYYQESYQGRIALVAGSERYGLSKPWYAQPHQRIHIPMLGKTADSLNVAVAATILLYEIGLQQRGCLLRSQDNNFHGKGK